MYQNIKIKEIDYCDPLAIFTGLQDRKWAIFFDSAMQHIDYGRYSYIAIDPFKVLWAKDGLITIDDEPITTHQNPFHLLKELLAQMTAPRHPGLPPFQGGAAGAFAYDLYQYIENIQTNCVDDAQFPDMAIGFYDVVISFDALQKKTWIVSTGWPENNLAARLSKAEKRLNEFVLLINTCKNAVFTEREDATLQDTSILQEPAETPFKNISSNFNSTTYGEAVSRVIDYILAGDIFEANISQRFKSKLPPDLSPFVLYQHLRKKNPAPFSAFMNIGDTFVVSASPERFLQLMNGFVEARPIKGTRPRSHDQRLDEQLAKELTTSEKDRAENVMIVDLLRNDLSKVCKDHSVNVTQLCGLESYATVHHLVSVVTGELKPHQDAIDLLLAAFPGGSITGAPKIRAIQIIAEIEPTKRGIYCGSIGFIGFNGTMDTSIAIRTYMIKDNVVTFQAGGAIVADSNPHEEYIETLAKSSALHQALRNTLGMVNDITD